MALRAAVARHVLGLTLRREFVCHASTSRRASSSAALSRSDDTPTSTSTSSSSSPSSHSDNAASSHGSVETRREREVLPANDWDGALRESAERAGVSKDLIEGFTRAPRDELEPFAPPEPPPKRKRPRKGWKTPVLPSALRPEWQTAMLDTAAPRKSGDGAVRRPRPRSRPTSQAKLPGVEDSDAAAVTAAPRRWPVTPAKPWYRHPLRPNPATTIEDIVALPPQRAPNRITAYLQTLKTPTTVGEMHAHLQRLRVLIEHITPQTWGNLSAYRRRVLLTLWSRWLRTAARLHDLGALPRMRGYEGREFAAERFNSLFLTIVAGKVKPRRGDNWRKWMARVKAGELTPEEAQAVEEVMAEEAAEEASRHEEYDEGHVEGLDEGHNLDRGVEGGDVSVTAANARFPDELSEAHELDDSGAPEPCQKGPATHYTPPTLYADSPIEKHIEFDQSAERATRMRQEALAKLRARHARQSLPSIAAAVAFMGSVEATPTPFQIQLIFTHLMDHISLKELMSYVVSQDDPDGNMRAVTQRLHALLAPPDEAALDAEGVEAFGLRGITRFDSDTHLPARGQARRMDPQRKTLILTASDVVLSHIEQGSDDPRVYKWWLDAADTLEPEWRFFATRYHEGYLRAMKAGQAMRVPTLKEAHALHLLARYSMAVAPRSAMRRSDFEEGTLGDPLYCLQLLIGSSEGAPLALEHLDQGGAGTLRPRVHSPPRRAPEVDQRIISIVVRWARTAAQRGLLSPIIDLLRILASPSGPKARSPTAPLPPPPIPLRTAIYLAGSVRATEDVARILPLLERVAVRPDRDIAREVDTAGWRVGQETHVGNLSVTRSGPHAVLARVLRLARQADEEGMGVREEERLLRMCSKWKLPKMGPMGETDGSVLTRRTATRR